MSRMTEKEYDDWCDENGICKPNSVCKSCGRRNHYVCADCESTFFQPERSKPLEAREDFVKHDYMLETPKAL